MRIVFDSECCTCLFQIGIIGGSGLDDPDIIQNRREVEVDTPYGKVCVCMWGGGGGRGEILVQQHPVSLSQPTSDSPGYLIIQTELCRSSTARDLCTYQY